VPVPSGTDATGSSQRINFLKQLGLFAALGEKELAVLSQDFSSRGYGKGQVIFQQGDPGTELFVVKSGRVRIFQVAPSGNETLINIFSTGDILGEFAAIDEQPRSATAQALTACALLKISRENFMRHLSTMPALALGLIRELVAKLRWTTAYAETIAQYDAAGRLLHILLLYNERFGQVQETGKRSVLDLGLNQSDLASLIGVRREWINRLLQEWAKRRLIEHDGSKIIILDLPLVIAERDSHIEARGTTTAW
jgi:CRP-like cAMP-binding protein